MLEADIPLLTMFNTPGRSRASPRGRPKQIPDGPILDFTAIVENTPSESWQKRANALQSLVDSIPHGPAYLEGGADWYNTPATLRHLARPISELLKDARSTVVKRVCENLLDLFNKCQIDARYLFKDLMISILAVHAQTVHIIRQAVQNMVMESIPEVPCKMVMPLWMERLKTDKSRTVREACAVYLGRALQCWTEEGYLTSEIWMQVGSTLLRSLRDPSPNVRSHSKSALEYIQRHQPHHWETLINDPAGPAARDAKLQRWLKSLEQSGSIAGDAAEELSIASRFSYNSDSRFTKSNLRISSPRVRLQPNDVLDGDAVPYSIAVTHKGKSGPGPPLPIGRAPFPQALSESPLVSNRIGTPAKQFTPSQLSTTFSGMKIRTSPTNNYENVDFDYSDSVNADGDKIHEGKDPSMPIHVDERNRSDAPATNAPYNVSTNLHLSDGQMILSTEDLRKLAARRRSHSSILMQELFRRSTKFGNGVAIAEEEPESEPKSVTERPQQDPPASESLPTSPESDGSPSMAQPPEHMVIAIRLLRAHKSHVDQIMETLKIEMDTLRDFDRLLEEPGRPTEEEVLNYFESVGLCLDQRFLVGRDLQREMDRISRGEPSQL